MKPYLKDVSLVCVDTTPKSHQGLRAIARSLEQCSFGAVKFFTNNPVAPFAVPIEPLRNIEDYSRFCVRDLPEHIETSHCLVIQHDGYVLNGKAWSDEFLNYDYIGAPFNGTGPVGNGGFSLRSKKLMDLASEIDGQAHPEDQFLCRQHRAFLEGHGCNYAPVPLAARFAMEGAVFNWGETGWASDGRKWTGEFGFHSWLTPLPGITDRPKIFHHSGDLGDIIYSLATIKALGGGVLYLSPDNRHQFPGPTRVRMSHAAANNAVSFLQGQDCIWQAKYTPNLPHATDYDLNSFREYYRSNTPAGFDSLYHLQGRAFNLKLDESPWLQCPDPLPIPGCPVVVARSPRYHNQHFPWRRILAKYSTRMVFVGSLDEYRMLCSLCASGKYPAHHPTPDVMQLARVIAGGRCFIGNQSTPLALALGLGQNVIEECWQGNPNCLFPSRKNAIFWGVDTVNPNLDIPPAWLEG